jgi:hypothetical protein
MQRAQMMVCYWFGDKSLFHEGIPTSRCRSIITISTAPPPISW